MNWARPVGRPFMHVLDRVVAGIAYSVCREAWIGADTVELYDCPDPERRCPACVDLLVARRVKEWAQRAPEVTP